MTGFTFLEAICGIAIPIAISLVALMVSHFSNLKMKVLTAYHVDEKLAMMAVHHHDIATGGCSFDFIYRFKNDLKAISELKMYISPDKRENLNELLPVILTMLRTRASTCRQDPKWNDAFEEVEQIVKEFDKKPPLILRLLWWGVI